MKQSKLTGGKRFQKWIEKGDLPNRGGYFIDIYNQMYNNLAFVQLNYTFGWGTEHNSGSNKLHLDEGDSAVERSRR